MIMSPRSAIRLRTGLVIFSALLLLVIQVLLDVEWYWFGVTIPLLGLAVYSMYRSAVDTYEPRGGASQQKAAGSAFLWAIPAAAGVIGTMVILAWQVGAFDGT